MENQEEIIQEAVATLKYARISSRKVKIVADLIRGKNVDEALATVKFTPKAASEIIEKLLKSAIANAENLNRQFQLTLNLVKHILNRDKEQVIIPVLIP